MSDIGIIKEIDNPKEMRQLYKLEKDVELVITANGILLKNPDYILVKKPKKK